MVNKKVVGNRVIEGGEIKVYNPPVPKTIVPSARLLEQSVCALPVLGEENRPPASIQEIAEHHSPFHSSSLLPQHISEHIGDRLEDDLVLDVQKSKGPLKARALW